MLAICTSEQSSIAHSNSSSIVTLLAREKNIRRDTYIPLSDNETIETIGIGIPLRNLMSGAWCQPYVELTSLHEIPHSSGR